LKSVSPQSEQKPTMIRLLAVLSASVFAFLSASCGCCTSEPEPPGLRPLPQFQEVPAAEVEYQYTK